MNDAIVLFSGGADSTTLLYHVLKKLKKSPLALSFDYQQRHKKRELGCAKKICKKLGIPQKILKIDLGQIGGSPLTDKKLSVPKQSEKQQRLTVVPYRNTIFITYAAAVAEVEGINEIYIGACKEDYENYRDCRNTFFRWMERTLCFGGTQEGSIMRVRRPFVNYKKEKIVRLGLKLDVPFARTWTCYKGRRKPCNSCDSCRERIEAFMCNGIKDPLYTNAEWERLKNG